MASMGELPFVIITAGKATAHIFLQGAHVGYWKAACGRENLYLSPKMMPVKGKPVRGGVPICWPQFSDLGPLKASHGFARNSTFELLSVKSDGARTVATLALTGKPEDEAFPGHSYRLLNTVTLFENELRVELCVENHGAKPLTFNGALHTYFAVTDIAKAHVEGFDATPFANNLENRAMKPAAKISVIDQEVDRIYYGLHQARLVDEADGTVISVIGENMSDFVLWNPWIAKTKKMADLPEDGYRHFVCLENCVVKPTVDVAPNGVWRGAQIIKVEKIAGSKI